MFPMKPVAPLRTSMDGVDYLPSEFFSGGSLFSSSMEPFNLLISQQHVYFCSPHYIGGTLLFYLYIASVSPQS